LAQLTQRRNVLVVLDRSDDLSYKSLRNLQNVHVLPVDQLNAYDILLSDDLVFTKAALDAYIAGPGKGASVKAVATSAEAAKEA
jgi:large subunit ribosomal protein L4